MVDLLAEEKRMNKHRFRNYREPGWHAQVREARKLEMLGSTTKRDGDRYKDNKQLNTKRKGSKSVRFVNNGGTIL